MIKNAKVILFAGMIIFTGCGGGNTEKKADNTILRVAWWGGGARHDATLKAIEKYMEKNPHIKIEAEYGGFDGYYQKVMTQFAGGVAPDIVQLDVPWLPEMVKNNMLIDLNQHNETIKLGEFDKSAIDNVKSYGGGLVGLPTGMNGGVFMFKSSLDPQIKAKIKDNMTWDEFISLGNELYTKSEGKNHLTISDTGGIRNFVLRRVFVQILGENMVDDNYVRKFKKEDAEKVFEIIDKLYSNNVLPELKNTLPYDAAKAREYPRFIEGHVHGSLEQLSVMDATKAMVGNDIKWDVVALPVIENAKDPGTWVRPSQVFSVSKNSKNVKEAAKFLNYIYNDEEAVKVLGTTRAIPPVAKARDILLKEGKISPDAARAIEIVDKYPGLRQNIPEYEQTLRAIELEFIQKVALKELNPQQAGEEFIKRYDSELSRLKPKK